ncbi:MAG: RsmD family RNA methyltransferase, partial [Rhodococcus sp. (in: high G+C Gram-positive bacteria)]
LPGAVVRAAPVAAVVAGEPERRFDLVLADPPYSVSDSAVASVLARLVEGEWLADDALVVVERSFRSAATAWPDGLAELRAKRYGEARVDMAQFEAVDGAG